VVAGSVPRSWAIVGVLVPAAVCAGLGILGGLPWWAGPAAVAAAVLVGLVTAAHAVLRLGGITGDVLGAVVETGTAAAAVVLACGLAPLTQIGG
jgi:adenosylcobinamide-GDP ribazoletransferase